MKNEIEAKFLDVDFDALRARLRAAGAVCEKPMRLMRRVMFNNPEMKVRHSWVRVRDEGDKVTAAYKQIDEPSANGVFEVETRVEDFDAMVQIFKQIGIGGGSFQESKRETWRLNSVEIMLDEWPWLKPYIEIEGKSEAAIRAAAEELGFDYAHAKFGNVMAAYRAQYPYLKHGDTVGNLPEVKFGAPLPDMFKPDKR